ncbi:PQQ-binding-like beta-propeller repeat protein [Blastopirellula sp. JC732]|uniref:PQQ-binding-like beta-propeller repeat protein n=1 Tax=Blastopirellula sediminis TaxID=2894196 RepID=A0A9X1MJA0_9BACT|nr:PQQ-binding-like beta-propeller repeat protein [Blastopirellula sediminis]MCC9609452.1 PQQ-binding-like beta-propeller repeat protein [Blastopirellula sediminis]MCC9627771.1 PQQ-binding-like beta-propeller repeat protein [Blastopirellula sediminis]
MIWLRNALFFLTIPLIAAVSRADEWPQILGPTRNGVAAGEKLADKWPEEGPPLAWKKSVGAGYAGPVIAQGQVILFHRIGNLEVVESLDLQTGEKNWSTSFDATYQGSIVRDNGPRCTPLVAGDAIILLGAAGNLYCVDFATGKRRWDVDLVEKYGAQDGYFGFGSTPIAIDGNVLVNVGGRGDAGIVAFDRQTGKEKWKATNFAASYAAPSSVTIGAKTWAIFVTRLDACLIDPETGRIGFQFPFGMRGPTVNGATSIVWGDHLFVTSSYGVGAKLVKFTDHDSKVLWANDNSMSSQYNTPIYLNGALYGINGREDVGTASLTCIDAMTGKVHWTREGFGTAHLILADDKLIAIANNGAVYLLKPDPKQYQQLSGFQGFSDVPRAVPALADGLLVARDTSDSGRGQLKCFRVGKK